MLRNLNTVILHNISGFFLLLIPNSGAECYRFESYIRSPCYCLAPLILSPSILSYVAAPILDEFVSISPGTELAWTALPYLFKLTILTKTFCPS